MGMNFRSPPRSYAPEAPQTPYARAQQEWDRRMGGAVNAATVWRNAAIGAAGLAFLACGGLIALALQSRTFVHVVEVSPEGSVLSVRPADGAYSPTDAQLSYFLGQFIKKIRSVPNDPVVLRQNWLEAYQYLGPKAAQSLNDDARADDPFATGRSSRSVELRSIVQRSEHAWQVSWVESLANAASGASARVAYTGLFTIEVHPPRDSDALAKNPLGIFITEFSFSPDAPQELQAGALP